MNIEAITRHLEAGKVQLTYLQALSESLSDSAMELAKIAQHSLAERDWEGVRTAVLLIAPANDRNNRLAAIALELLKESQELVAAFTRETQTAA